jgi:hypothetical protein
LRKQSCRSARSTEKPTSWIFFFPPVVFLRYGFQHFLLHYTAWRTRFWRRLHGTPIRSVPFRVDGPVVCQRLLDRRRWRRGAGSNRRDHPSPVNQECIRTNCEFISSSLIATSTGKAFRTPVAQRDLAEACIGARRIR